MDKQEEILRNRLIELSKISYERNIITYSDFLNLNELNLLQCIPKNELYSRYELFGGYRYAERQMVAFIPDALCYENIYPISAISVTPRTVKYADKLTHRDFLGSILGLGIERCKVGDILVQDKEAIVFVHKSMESFIMEHFIMVKHTSIMVALAENSDDDFTPEYEEIKGTVSSIRLDSIIALVLRESRSKIIRLIEGGKVFVNGKLITTNAYKLQESDLISIRGFGKFQYISILSKTKKDRFYISLNKFI